MSVIFRTVESTKGESTQVFHYWIASFTFCKYVKYSETFENTTVVIGKTLLWTTLYAPQFSHTPLYKPQIRNTVTTSIVIDGN